MRKKWYKSSVATVLTIAMLIPAAAVSAAESKTDLSYTVTKKSAQEKAAMLTSGYGAYSVQYALFDQGKIVVSGQAGMNDKKGQIPLSGDTVYGIGSVSKVYCCCSYEACG